MILIEKAWSKLKKKIQHSSPILNYSSIEIH